MLDLGWGFNGVFILCAAASAASALAALADSRLCPELSDEDVLEVEVDAVAVAVLRSARPATRLMFVDYGFMRPRRLLRTISDKRMARSG